MSLCRSTKPSSTRKTERRPRSRAVRGLSLLTAASLLCLQVPARAADVFWQLLADGFWDVSANWGGSVPTSADDVFNNTLFQITHRSGSNAVNSFRSLTANGGGGSLVVSGGELRVNTLLDTDGNVTVSNGATLRGQSAATTTFRVGGNFALQNGILSDVSIQNSNRLKFAPPSGFNEVPNNILRNVALDSGLDLSPYNSQVRIAGSTTFGTAAPVFTLGDYCRLSFQGDRTLDNTTIAFIGYGEGYLNLEGNTTLTLPSSFRLTGNKGVIGSGAYEAGTGIIRNSGVIWQDIMDGRFSVSPTEFHNLSGGLIHAEEIRASITIAPQTFVNEGTVEAVNGGVVLIYPTNPWTATGALRADGGILRLGGTVTLDTNNVPTTANGGSIDLGGTLNNVGRTFDVTTSIGGTHKFVINQGRILGGAVTHSELLRFDNSGVLENVALDNSLDLSDESSRALLVGTTTLGTAPTVTLGRNSKLSFQGDFTLDNTTVRTSSSGTGNLYTTGTTHLGLPSTFRFTGNDLRISSDTPGGIVTSATTLSQDLPNGRLLIDPFEFHNLSGGTVRAQGNTGVTLSPQLLTSAGSIEARDGGVVSIAPQTLKLGGTVLTDGTGIAAGSSITIRPAQPWVQDAAISVSNQANLTLQGTLTLGERGSLTTASNGIIYLGGTLDNTGRTFDVTTDIGGTHSLQLSNGRILGGNVTHSNLLRFSYGFSTLENVALDNGLDLTPIGSRVRIAGTTILGAANPIINLGRSSEILFQGDRTLDNTTVVSNSDGGGSFLAQEGTTLTLPDTFRMTGRYAYIGTNFAGSGSVMRNSGLISQNVAGGKFEIRDELNFQNLSGGIVRADGSQTRVEFTGRTVSNAGTIEARGGGSVLIEPRGTWDAGGIIRADGAGSLVELKGKYTVSGTPFETVGAGQILLRGTLDNTGRVFDATGFRGSRNVFFQDGTLLGGSVVGSSSLRFTNTENRLENVALDSGLTINGGKARILGSTTFGANPILNLSSTAPNLSSVVFHESRTLDNFTVLNSSAGSARIYTRDAVTLTLPNTFHTVGSIDFSEEYQHEGGTIINSAVLNRVGISTTNFKNLSEGVVQAEGDRVRSGISAKTPFVNEGKLEAGNGGLLSVRAPEIINAEVINIRNTPGNIAEGGGVELVSTKTPINRGTIEVGKGTHLNFSNLIQESGTIHSNGSLMGGNAALLDIQGGTLQAAGRIESSVRNNSLFMVGDSTAFLTITNDYTQTSNGTLVVDLNGAQPGYQYDWLDVLKTGQIDGTLTVNLNYVPQPNTVFTIAGFGTSYSGRFSAINAPAGLEILYNAKTIQLRAVPAPSSVAILAMGLLGMGGILRRRRQSSAMPKIPS